MTGADTGLSTVSVRRRVTLSVLAVLAVVLVGLGLVVNAIFTTQAERSLTTIVNGRAQLARQLARSGVGPQQVVNRVDGNGVEAHLLLRSGDEFGTALAPGDRLRVTRTMLSGPGRVDRARLTLAVDTALVDDARASLRRALLGGGALALVLSAALVTVAVRVSLRPLTSMAALAQAIAAGRRGSRLAPSRTDTDIGRTAAAFDEMLDELEGAESRAQAAEQRSRAFLADAAHEMRTPIAGVQAAAETLLQRGDQLARTDREQLEILLIREARRAGTLVSDLLAAARIDAGDALELAPVSLDRLAAQEVDRVQTLRPEASVRLQADPVEVTADGDKLTGVLRNLMDNAARAIGSTGSITVQVRPTADGAEVVVTDSGPGVSPEQRELIFERLVRLDHGRVADRGGSGLGLAIARGYARLHGGELTCLDPGPAGGAVFRLVLPLHPDASGQAARDQTSAS